jgi:hypothetical protein
MRQVYLLLGLARRYGDAALEVACGKALEVDVVAVGKIASMLERAAENSPAAAPRPSAVGPARYARDPAEYATRRAHLPVVHDSTTGGVDGEGVR